MDDNFFEKILMEEPWRKNITPCKIKKNAILPCFFVVCT